MGFDRRHRGGQGRANAAGSGMGLAPGRRTRTQALQRRARRGGRSPAGDLDGPWQGPVNVADQFRQIQGNGP